MISVYRCFSSAGELLYVGASRNAFGRLAEHRLRSPWFADVASIRIDACETPEEAFAAEREAIHLESPKFNVAHNSPWPELVEADTGSALTEKALATMVRLAVVESGRDRQSIADDAGMSESGIRAIEAGHCPSVVRADRLLRVLGRSLVLGDPEGPPIEIREVRRGRKS